MNKLTVNNDILRDFRLFTGLSDAEAAAWNDLITAATASIDRRLRDRSLIEENIGRLSLAAAAVAYFHYKTITAAETGGLTLKAGDLSMQRGGGDAIKAAAAMRDEAMLLAGDLLTGDGFDFRVTG